MIKTKGIPLANFGLAIKYYFVGGMINILGYLLFLWLVAVGMDYRLSATLMYFIGIGVSFIINRSLVFTSDIPLKKAIQRLILMLLGGYILNLSCLLFFVDFWKCDPGVIQLFSILLVSIYFYYFNKWYVHEKNND